MFQQGQSNTWTYLVFLNISKQYIMQEISQVKVSLEFAFIDGEQHSETDMQMTFFTQMSHNNKLHPCRWWQTCDLF